jgi:hypothetical protein
VKVPNGDRHHPGWVRETVDDLVTTVLSSKAPPPETLDLLDAHLPTYDVVLTEHLVVDADTGTVFEAAKNFDFMTTRSRLVTALMTARSVPSRVRGRPVVTPPALMLARDAGALPGWVLLGEVPGREVVFGAVGKFWNADIEWHDVTAAEFADFAEPGWGKIACHLLVRPDGPARSILSYECRTATTDPVSQRQMSRYWWLIRPFVGYVLRAVIRTIRESVGDRASPGLISPSWSGGSAPSS